MERTRRSTRGRSRSGSLDGIAELEWSMSARPAIVHTLKPPRVGIGPADTSAQLHPPINQTTSAAEKPLYVRTKAPAWLPQVLAPVIGIGLFVAVWAIVAEAGARRPDPVSACHS